MITLFEEEKVNKHQCIIKWRVQVSEAAGRGGVGNYSCLAPNLYLLFQTLTLDSGLSNKIVVLEIIRP